ncbi:MAG: hypothetical protein K0R80_16 [Clostridia bacterium]|jgi:hypothetical protein|nr:hypothetical protein [Clostridia bacterium]
MIKMIEGTVKNIYFIDENITKFIALIDNLEHNCINYNSLTGCIRLDDKVLLNTTAIELQLGTGGFHFVVANLSNPMVNNLAQGHIMKMKYTPIQMNFMTVETQESQYHHIFNEFESLDGMPVIIGSLHSVLAPSSIYLKSIRPELRICYIMTEGGALPIYMSDIVRQLKQEGFIDKTITYGNSFGGDFECINIYTALIAAKEIVRADIAIVCMGPGIVGTDTKLGFSGVEQGGIADAVNKLKGYAAVVPRISFADKRIRHYGISHHSLTVLKQLCCTRVNVAFPIIKNTEYMKLIEKQILENNIESLHNINYVDSYDIEEVLSNHSKYLKKMGKGLEEDRDYFISCAAAAKLCLRNLN